MPGFGFEDMLDDLDIPESLSFLADESQNGSVPKEDPYSLPKDGSMDWESLPSGTQLGRDDGTSARETSSLDAQDWSTAGADMGAGTGGLMSTFKNGVSAVSGFMKENPQLTQAALAGVAGAFKDKSAQETARMQIDYLKEKQAALNNSVTAYGKTYRKA